MNIKNQGRYISFELHKGLELQFPNTPEFTDAIINGDFSEPLKEINKIIDRLFLNPQD